MNYRTTVCPAAAAVFFFSFLLLFSCEGTPLPYELIELGNIKSDTEYQVNVIGIRAAGSEKERETGDWIFTRLAEYGFETITEQTFPVDLPEPLESRNIIVCCNPESGGAIIDIVAHYDSVSTSPGARDNAASVAALLEIARILGPKNKSIPCEIRLVFLGSEENGYWGSRWYVRTLPEMEIPRHIAAFNMDISIATEGSGFLMTCNTLGGRTAEGYAEGDAFEPRHNMVSRSIEAAYRELYGSGTAGPRLHHYGESDHLSFHQAGIDSANVGWRTSRLEPGFAGLPTEYHKMSDTAEALDYTTIETTVRCLLFAAGQIALGRIE